MIDDTDELTGAAPPMFNNAVNESRNSGGSFGEADFSINPAVEVSPKANLLTNLSCFSKQKPY